MTRPFLMLLTLFVCSALPAWAADEQGEPWGLAELMARMAQVKTEQANFEEVKTLAMLQEPIRSTGRLYYRAPSYMMKQVLTPQKESFESDGDWLQVETANHRGERFRLSSNLLLRGLTEAIRGTLAGDVAALQNFYALHVEGDASAWTLRLYPNITDVANHVESIVITGAGNRIARFETIERDGDRSMMIIDVVAVD